MSSSFEVEVAIERHLARARGFGDCFDADPADAAAVEEILGAVEDPVAGPPGPWKTRDLGTRTRFFFVHGA